MTKLFTVQFSAQLCSSEWICAVLNSFVFSESRQNPPNAISGLFDTQNAFMARKAAPGPRWASF